MIIENPQGDNQINSEVGGKSHESEPNNLWPPKKGMLENRYMQDLREINGEKQWITTNEDIQYFDRVGKPGESWHYRTIARSRYVQGQFEPYYGSGAEGATSAPTEYIDDDRRVVHQPLSDFDLERIILTVYNYCEEKKASGLDGIDSWIRQVVDSVDLDPAERARFEAISRKFIASAENQSAS